LKLVTRGIFGVADYEYEVTFWKFKMSGRIWRKTFSRIDWIWL